MSVDDSISAEETEALKIAGELIDAGVPIFAAAPNPDRPGDYYLPKGWERTVPSRSWLDKWRPGWALGAVGGHVADFLDFDPRNGGSESEKELRIQGQMPRAFGVQATPSGGTHLIVSLTGERKSTGFMPGVDLQAGNAEGVGRGFIYIAPTVRPSKAPETLGELRPYVWEQRPDTEHLAEWASGSGSPVDDSLDGILARVHAARERTGPSGASGARPAHEGVSQLFTGGFGPAREFTRAEAETFCLPHLTALEGASIGSIEECANRAAAALSHFVPALWSADEAFQVLMISLNRTAYDPDHPASGWHASKFLAVLDGRRPALDDWKASRRVTREEAAAAFGHGETDAAVPATEDAAEDLIGAMLARMLTPGQMSALPPPQPLVKGLLDLDSLCWIIGAPGSFKSFVALDLAAHVGGGLAWHGMPTTSGPVVYVAAEGTRGMGKRIRAWERKYGRMADQVLFLPLPVKIKDVVAWQTLVEACRRIRPVMVVIDTQARVTAGVEENSNTDMGVAIDAFDAVKRATGACVLVVHHTGRNGQDARGASAIDGAQDTELKLTRQEPRSSMVVKLTEDKQKDMAESAEGIVLRLVEETVSGQGEEALTSLRVGDMWEGLEGGQERPADPAGSVVVSEPQPWTFDLVPGPAGSDVIKRQLLQTIADLAGSDGLDLPAIRRSLTERWYADRSASGRTRRGVDEQTWNRTWTAVKSLQVEGEEVIVPGATARRFTLNRLVTGQ